MPRTISAKQSNHQMLSERDPKELIELFNHADLRDLLTMRTAYLAAKVRYQEKLRSILPGLFV